MSLEERIEKLEEQMLIVLESIKIINTKYMSGQQIKQLYLVLSKEIENVSSEVESIKESIL